MKRVLIFAFCLIAFGLVAQVIYQPHRRNAFRSKTAAAFQPSDVAGLVMWYDASSIGSPTNVNGYLVTNWYDKSISSFTLKQTTSASQPYYTNNVSRLGGKPWLEFDGSNDSLSHQSGDFAQPLTIFAVLSTHSFAATRYAFGSTNASAALNFQNYASAGRWGLTAGTAIFSALNAIAVDQWYLVECTYTNGGSALLTNGFSVIAGDANINGLSGLRVGSTVSGSANFWLGGIAEIWIYTNNLSAGDRTLNRNYAIGKYGAFSTW